MERFGDGRSFADAVRSALTESVGSGVDDEGQGGGETSANERKAVIRRREKTEKVQRKEVRRKMRELRRLRRSERIRKHALSLEQQSMKHNNNGELGAFVTNSSVMNTTVKSNHSHHHQHDSTESEAERGQHFNGRPLYHCDNRTRRRRRERDSATRRKRSDWSSTSDSDDLYPDRCRRRMR